MVRSPSRNWWVGAVAALLLAGCYEDGEDQVISDGDAGALPAECQEGERRPCDVSDGCGGEQLCLANGTYGPCSAPDEICDGVDNDCDGVTDEEFPTLGDSCEAGEGTCNDKGSVVCTADGSGTMCDARPGDMTDEVCDGVDNDCDGTTDEDAAAGMACDTGLPGVCSAGTTTCDAGDTVCSPTVEASDESCDGLDNDCDSNVDEAEMGGPLVESCYDGPEGTVDVGACVAGVRQCSDGMFGACVDQVVPADEICDGIDNDCDGTVDNVAEGDCVCEPGALADCYDGPDGTRDIGICRGGTRTCNETGTGYGACVGQRTPGAEICDGADNDCDGQVDDVAGAGEACSAGQGACAADGVRVCDLESGQLVCDAQPGLPADETCDGVDNDCDGVIDDVPGVGDACEEGVGACLARGVFVCDVAAGGVVCDAEPGAPSDEVCDGRDNDCNGEVDDAAGAGEPCEAGVGACRSTATTVCDPVAGMVICPATAQDAAPAEYCGNDLDDDCDGETDEPDCVIPCVVDGDCQNPGDTCIDGACVATPCDVDEDCPAGQSCVDQSCVADEICDDTIDNDRDGATDCDDADCADDPACPAVEICDNGLDDDEDGDIDCADADCQDDPFCGGPGGEICDNGQDDDDDGLVDCLDDECSDDPACIDPTLCDGAPALELGRTAGALVGESRTNTASCTFPVDGADGPEMVYAFTPAAGGTYCIDTAGSVVDTVLTVRGEPCDAPTSEIACSDDNGDFDLSSQVEVELLAGTAYYVVVDTFDGGDGPFVVNVRAGGCDAPPVEICDDGFDNDDDGDVDCDDLDCALDPACPILGDENCGDGIDNDGDGDVDCADADCGLSPLCVEDCNNNLDDDGDGDIDCDDLECVADLDCLLGPDEICDNGQDDDGDGAIDCDDADCAGDPICPPPAEICDNGQDDDGDGDVDCDDADCDGDPACAPVGGTCEQPFALDGPGVYQGDTSDAPSQYVETDPDCVSIGTNAADSAEHIYAFTPEGDATYCFSLAGSSFDTVMYARAGVCDDPAAEVVCNDDNREVTNGTQSAFDLVATGGTTYYIFVDGYSTGRDGPYTLTVSEGPCIPPDEICDNGEDDDGDGDVDCDDADCAGDPTCAPPVEICDNGQDDDGDGDIDCDDADCNPDFRFDGDALDARFETAGAAPWFVEDGLATSGDIGNNQESILRLPVSTPEGGRVSFRYRVSSEVGGAGQLYDSLEFRVDGVIVQAWAGEIPFTYFAVDLEPGDHVLTWRYEKDVSDSSGEDRAQIDDVVVQGDARSCPPPVEICDNGEDEDLDGDIDCDDADCRDDPACGDIALGCDAPRAIGFETRAVQLEGESAIDNASCTLPVDGADGPEGVFAFTAEADGTVCVDTLGSMVDTVLTVRGEPCEGPGSEVACDDDGGMAGTSQVEFDTAAGETWFIVVDTFAGERGEAMVTVADGPCEPIGPVEICNDGDDNDDDGLIDCADTDCAGNIACNNPLVCLGADPVGFGTQQGELDGASVTSLASCAFPANSATGPEALYLFTAIEAGTVCADTFGSAVDTILTARDETCNRPQSELACSDDEDGFASQVELEVEAGELYYFAVDTYAGDRGAYTFRLRPGACDDPIPAEICGNGDDDDFDGAVDCDDSDCADLPACADPDDVCSYDFEGGLDPAFETDGDAPWTIEGGVATSGAIADDEVSTLRLRVSTPAGGAVSFRYRVSSERNFDDFRFLVDGVAVLDVNGEIAFTDALFPLPPGDHVLEWVYDKDSSDFDGEDLAQIDDVVVSGTGGVCDGAFAEICDNGQDDDRDGDLDCADADCQDDPGCVPDEICDNGADDDGDGDVDCDDADCALDPACLPPIAACTFDFEGGALDPAFETDGAAPWFVDAGVATSGDIGDNQRSNLRLAVSTPAGGAVSFRYRVSSEEPGAFGTLYDYLEFSVDGVPVLQEAGEVDFTDFEIALTPGDHVLEWAYIKDISASQREDRVQIDDLVVEGALGLCEAGDVEICDNGADDDGDGDVDCDDADCALDAACLPPLSEQNCEDGLDDDGDGDIDCADADCAVDPACAPPGPELNCEDGLDDDGDGDIDCADADCAADPVCLVPPAEICDNGLDDDADGDIDCADADCAGDPACAPPAAAVYFSFSDFGRSALYRLEPEGAPEYVADVTFEGDPVAFLSMAMGPDGVLYGFVDLGDFMVATRIDPVTGEATALLGIDDQPVLLDIYVVGAGVAPDGTVYVIDYFGETVRPLGPFGLGAPVIDLPAGFDGGDIAFGPDGSCYLNGIDSLGNSLGLYRCDVDAGTLAPVALTDAGFDDDFPADTGLAFGVGPDPCVGGLYGAEGSGSDEISFYDLAGDPVALTSVADLGVDIAFPGLTDAAGWWSGPVDPGACAPVFEVDCDDGLDDDGDGDIDCADLDCAEDPACLAPPAEICDNGADDDGDGDVDCDDADCLADPSCLVPLDEICDNGLDDDADGDIDCADADCAGDPACDEPPLGGDLIITEIMYDPVVVGDNNGEWLELYNASDAAIDLQGWALTDDGTDRHVINASVVIQPGAYALLGRNADPALNGGVALDYVYASYSLANTDDEVVLVDPQGVPQAAVRYDERTVWPIAAGASLQFDADADRTIAANGDVANWCLSTAPFGAGDLGTPGGPNASCNPAVVAEAVDFCRLQFPDTIEAAPGDVATVYGRLYQEGVTDQSPATDPTPGVAGQVGYLADGADPADPGAWTWFDAVPNAGYDGNAAGEANNDEYQADLTVPAEGLYNYAFRFTVDDGASWTLCDRDGSGANLDGGDGSSFSLDQAGVMLSEAPAPSVCEEACAEAYACGFGPIFNPGGNQQTCIDRCDAGEITQAQATCVADRLDPPAVCDPTVLIACQ